MSESKAGVESNSVLTVVENPQQKWVLLSIILGTGTVSISNSSFNPALPELMRVFELSEATVSWVLVIFLVSMSLSLLITGDISQRFGKRRVYLTALCIFMLSSLMGTFAQNIEWVFVTRAIQGFASGIMIPLSLGLIFAVTPQEKRGVATGLWGAMIMLTLACGPLLGALTLVFLDWTALFWLTVPIALIALWVGHKCLPQDLSRHAKKPFDWTGFVLLGMSIISLFIGISFVHEWSDLGQWQTLLLFVLSLLSLILFIYQSTASVHSIVDRALFREQSFNYSLMISISHTICLFICLLLVPLLIQNSWNLSPIWTGFTLMVSAFATSLCTKRAGQYLDQHAAKKLISFGMVISVLSFIGLAYAVNQSVYLFMFCMVLHGIGFGLSYMPATTAGLNQLKNQQLVTHAAAINNLLRRILSAVAVVLAGVYLHMQSQSQLNTHAQALIKLNAIQNLFLLCAGLLILALPFAWKFPSQGAGEIKIKD